ncbi:helix-turn-helix transcriptional regulator [Bacillus sp. FJAT-49705]|uniref:Helix-turn-helix transcriptional regulator n=1 Tax=Cytobacillus citreus TaxID=2833586 RepID=A0ABS5NS74_9BACI|nr:helix-turn-helix transcriptional regulator [Cytobacillus citreus]MBS4190642.1 helix-turn-helix transcriptional regulator [Cytobacillus citreus]
MLEKTYTPDEVAKMFKIAKNTVYELIKRGELLAFKVGNKMRIEKSEIDRFIDGRKPTDSSRLMSVPYQEEQLRLAGSHDFLIEQLIKYMTRQSSGLSVQPTFIGSLEGLMMLYRGNCDVAAIHLLDPSTKEYNLPIIKQLFTHEKITVLRLAVREQGIITAQKNPKEIYSFKDLARKDVRFVNRQKGSGTRFLLDTILADEKIAPSDIRGYENEEWNHLSTAAYISNGEADAAVGIRSAASKLDLNFIPIAKEKFDLVFRWTPQNEKALQLLMDIIQLTDFKESIGQSGGYDVNEFGLITYNTKAWRN